MFAVLITHNKVYYWHSFSNCQSCKPTQMNNVKKRQTTKTKNKQNHSKQNEKKTSKNRLVKKT